MGSYTVPDHESDSETDNNAQETTEQEEETYIFPPTRWLAIRLEESPLTNASLIANISSDHINHFGRLLQMRQGIFRENPESSRSAQVCYNARTAWDLLKQFESRGWIERVPDEMVSRVVHELVVEYWRRKEAEKAEKAEREERKRKDVVMEESA